MDLLHFALCYFLCLNKCKRNQLLFSCLAHPRFSLPKDNLIWVSHHSKVLCFFKSAVALLICFFLSAAALLLQGSVQVYSRKVEFLYSLVLHALEFLSQKK